MVRRSIQAARRGFTLVEAMVALGILSLFVVGVDVALGGAIDNTVWVMDLSDSTHLVEGVVLQIEDEFRLDGFPENDREEEDCSDFLPRDMQDRFECEYDLLALEVGPDNMGALGEQAMENVNTSPLMSAFCSGGADGMSAVDPALALANLQSSGQEMDGGLAAFIPLLDPGFTQVCGLNLAKMCQNTSLISSFIPMIIEQAAASTRKVKVRLSWGERFDETLEIETFITAVPEAEEEGP